MRKLSLPLILCLATGLLVTACGDAGSTPAPSDSFVASAGAIVQLPPTAIITTASTGLSATFTPQPAATSSSTATVEPTTTLLPAVTATEAASTISGAEASDTATILPQLTTRPAAITTTVGRAASLTTARPVQATATSAPYINNGLLSEVVRGRSGKKQIAITLDAGAGADPFPKLIAGINGAGVKLTFFLTGTWAQQNPTYVQQIVSSGMEIANHSWSHPDFTSLSNEAIRQEMEKTETLLSKFTGSSTKPLWRAPLGARDSRVLQLVNSMGYRSIYWTLDSLDSIGAPKSAQFLIDRITKQTDAQLDGQIILMHIGSATSAEALPAIIKNLKARGFKIVTVSQLLA